MKNGSQLHKQVKKQSAENKNRALSKKDIENLMGSHKKGLKRKKGGAWTN